MKSELKEADWIALRLLALLLKTDASNQTIPEVRKTIDHYSYRLGGALYTVIGVLIRETADEIENPASALMLRFEKTLVEKALWETGSDVTLGGTEDEEKSNG